MLLAKLKADGKFYAVKVLQKKVILKKKEVCVGFDVGLFSAGRGSLLHSRKEKTK